MQDSNETQGSSKLDKLTQEKENLMRQMAEMQSEMLTSNQKVFNQFLLKEIMQLGENQSALMIEVQKVKSGINQLIDAANQSDESSEESSEDKLDDSEPEETAEDEPEQDEAEEESDDDDEPKVKAVTGYPKKKELTSEPKLTAIERLQQKIKEQERIIEEEKRKLPKLKGIGAAISNYGRRLQKGMEEADPDSLLN